MSLRAVPFAEAVEALCTLPGVGPKVAACICLFSLDKHDAIPVDTHVWQLATRYYAPQLAGKALTPKLHGVVQEVFAERFGPYAGWWVGAGSVWICSGLLGVAAPGCVQVALHPQCLCHWSISWGLLLLVSHPACPCSL